METKVCTICGQEKPLEDFVKNKRAKNGRANHCKECHNKKYPCGYKKKVIDAPKVDEDIVNECKENHLESVPARLLISELRRRGYRGELELVTVQKVRI